jgi:hypothetical protein
MERQAGQEQHRAREEHRSRCVERMGGNTREQPARAASSATTVAPSSCDMRRE